MKLNCLKFWCFFFLLFLVNVDCLPPLIIFRPIISSLFPSNCNCNWNNNNKKTFFLLKQFLGLVWLLLLLIKKRSHSFKWKMRHFNFIHVTTVLIFKTSISNKYKMFLMLYYGFIFTHFCLGVWVDLDTGFWSQTP